jgi:polyisoprenoid-binding protein YceI
MYRPMLTLAALATALGLAGCGAPAAAPPASDSAAAPAATNAMAVQPTTEAPAAAPTTAAMAPATTSNTSGQAASAGAKTYVIQPDKSKVSYSVGETFFREGNRFNTAIGTTNSLNGEITLDHSKPSQSKVGDLTVNIEQFKSDSDRRDNKIRQQWLESSKFPMVTFKPTSISGLSDGATEGAPVTFQVTGDTTIRDTTKPLTFDVTATLNGDTLTGTATTKLKMTDFGFQPPDIAGMLKAENDVTINIEFVATPKQ